MMRPSMDEYIYFCCIECSVRVSLHKAHYSIDDDVHLANTHMRSSYFHCTQKMVDNVIILHCVCVNQQQ